MSRIFFWGCFIIGAFLLKVPGTFATPDQMHLIFDDRQLTINFQTQPQLLQTSHQHYLVFNAEKIPLDIEGALLGDIVIPGAKIETEFQIEVSPENLKTFFEESALMKRTYSHAVEIHQDEAGDITFEGKPQSGGESQL